MMRGSRSGFTLVELAIVIVILGMLAALGVPRFLRSVERSKAAEAFSYLSAVRDAQERHQARHGTYAANVTDLDLPSSAPACFTVGSITPGSTGTLEDSWTLTLTRNGAPSGYGNYSLVFTQDGFDPQNSTIATMPDINPLGTARTTTTN
jgi:type IV pilus assembly protein PilA